MSELFEDPPRWREHTDQPNLTERAFGQALRAIGTPPPLSGPQMVRLAARLRPPRARRSRVWILVAASFILGLATAASAERLNILPHWLTGTAKPQPPAATPEPRSRGLGRMSRPSTALPVPATPSADSELETTATGATQARQAIIDLHPATTNAGEQLRRPVTVAPPIPPNVLAEKAPPAPFDDSRSPLSPPPTESGGMVFPAPPSSLPAPERPADTSQARAAHVAMLGQPTPTNPASNKIVESGPTAIGDSGAAKILADAIKVLRADGSPESALVLLDRHAKLMAKSPYSHEAFLVRVDALLALKREGDLLRLLDGAALVDGAASRTLLVTRGRLRAAANRCAEAAADFDRILAEAGHADMQALQGRAACREKLGDAVGARADRERYRREFPGAP